MADLPERYGPWKTVYNRFWRWSRNGTLTALVARVRVIAEAVDELGREVDELGREVSVDSSMVRAHQHAAGGRKAGAGAVSALSPGGGAGPGADTTSQVIMLSGGPAAAPPPRST